VPRTDMIESVNTVFIFAGDYIQAFGNARNSSNQCIRTNYSSLCANQCELPASCDSATGRCLCPEAYPPVYSNITGKTTCNCPGYPSVTYANYTCDISVKGSDKLVLLEFPVDSCVASFQNKHGFYSILKKRPDQLGPYKYRHQQIRRSRNRCVDRLPTKQLMEGSIPFNRDSLYLYLSSS
jgi:hypothetical protein